MKTGKMPSQKYLKECFEYDSKTGILLWRHRPQEHFILRRTSRIWNTRYSGKTAGTKHYQNTGRGRTAGAPCCIVVRLNGIHAKIHTNAALIIFAMMGMDVSAGMRPDHKNNNPFDNSWDNLRLSTNSQNNSNRRVFRKHHLLPRGVTPNRSKFVAQIQKDSVNIYLGIFNTPEQAHAAYCKKAMELYGEFARFDT